MSHIYNLNPRTVHRGLTLLGQVKDCPLGFLCSFERLRPKDCPSVFYFGLVSSGIGHPWQGSVTEHSIQNQCSIGCDMSRDEATHYTIGVSSPP